MVVLFDTNVILDAFLIRNEYHDISQHAVEICAQKKVIGCISAITLPNIYFILRGKYTSAEKRNLIKNLCKIFEVSSLSKDKILSACERVVFKDFEDCLQEESAFEFNCSYIVTRNPSDYQNSRIPIISVEEFLQKVKNI